MIRSAILLLLAAFFLHACSDQPEPPKDLIEEDTYIDLLIELQLLRVYSETLTSDTTAIIDSLKTEIFTKYNVTEARFETSHKFYEQQIQEQKRRVTEAVDRLKLKGIPPDSINMDRTIPTLPR